MEIDKVSPESNGPMSTVSSASDFQVLTHPSPNGNDQSLALDFSHVQFDLDEMTGNLTLDEAVQRVKSLMLDNQQLKDSVMDSSAAIRHYHDILVTSQKKCEETEKELKKRNEESRRVVQNLMTRFKERDSKVKELNQTVNSMNSMQGAVSEHVADELQAKIDRLTEENRNLKVKQSQHVQQTSPSSSKKAGDASLQDELNTVNSRIKELKEKCSQLEQENEGLIMKHEQDSAELEKNRQFSEQIVNEGRAKNEENEKCLDRIKELENNNKKLVEDIDNLNAELSQKTETNKKILEEKADLLKQNMALHSELAEYRSQSIGVSYPVIEEPLNGNEEATGRLGADGASRGSGEESTRGNVDPSLDNMIQLAAGADRLAHSDVSNTEVKEAVKKTPEKSQRQSILLQQSGQRVEELTKKVEQLTGELLKAQNDIDEINCSHAKQIQVVRSAYEAELHSLKEQSARASGEDTLKAQVVSLLNEVHEEKQKAQAAINELTETKLLACQKDQQLMALRKEMEEERNQDDKVIDDMRLALVNVHKELKETKHQLRVKDHEYKSLHASWEQTCKDYGNLLTTFEQYRDELELRSAQNATAVQTKQALEQVDNLTAQILAAEESIAMKCEEIQKYKEACAKLQSDNEAIPILNAQAEVWKNDFETERRLREHVHAEKERIENEVVYLQRQVQQLQEELELSSRSQIMEMQRRHGAPYQGYAGRMQQGLGMMSGGPPRVRPITPPMNAHPVQFNQEGGAIYGRNEPRASPHQLSSSTGGSRTSEDEDLYRCPKCFIECPDFDTLNLHVLECLDQE